MIPSTCPNNPFVLFPRNAAGHCGTRTNPRRDASGTLYKTPGQAMGDVPPSRRGTAPASPRNTLRNTPRR